MGRRGPLFQSHLQWRVLAAAVLSALPDATLSKECYNLPMQRTEAMARLKAYQTELRQFGVQHLYLFGSTACGEARANSDVDLFFDHERGKLGLFQLRGCEGARCRNPRLQNGHYDAAQPTSILRERIEASALQGF